VSLSFSCLDESTGVETPGYKMCTSLGLFADDERVCVFWALGVVFVWINTTLLMQRRSLGLIS
jgi:hypothetical protein